MRFSYCAALAALGAFALSLPVRAQDGTAPIGPGPVGPGPAAATDDTATGALSAPSGTVGGAAVTTEDGTLDGDLEGGDVGAGSESSAGAGQLPWQEVPPPAFLDTTDRRIRDTRPAPTAAQVAALREMEAEVARFTASGNSYNAAVRSILRREHMQRRRDREQGYARQIREEERLQAEARERAIRLFERFIRRYPDDPTYTPDAMFRLGELYYERSAIAFQDAALTGEMPEEGHPDYMPTIQVYRELVRRFPAYRRIDGVYYLIGYCLNEMGQMEEARMAWLNLVCANKYHYTGAPTPLPADEGAQGEEGAPTEGQDHPALTLDATPEVAFDAPFVDPYVDCEPVIQDAEFVSETWLRIGEYHFDFDYEPHALDRAISAYNKVLATPDDRNYNLALYKVAWAYYRASRYPEAIETFARLVEWSDQEYERTGRAGSELRAEAIQYLGIAFAYDDWNEDQIPDPDEGLPSGFDRIRDPNLMPQDRPWTVEVYFQLGQIYFDEDRHDLAIQVWEYAIERWPLHHRVPEIINLIARANQRAQRLEEETSARARLADYAEGSAWWEANLDHPIEQRRAEQLAEASLINAAVSHHQEAVRLRREAVENRDEYLLQQAIAEYNAAAAGYREYIEHYPNSPDAYELQYNLADALFWSGQYEEAAREYAAVRDSNLDDRYLSPAARRVVESYHRLVDDAVRAGQFEEREGPPPVEPGPPPGVQPVQMPPLVQELAQAREVYLARVDEEHDSEHVRPAYDYNNTLLLYNYGYWPQARERFTRIYEERCNGPLASAEGQTAYFSLRNMAVQLGDTEEVGRLARDLQERRCTFSPDVQAGESVDCEDPANAEHPLCVAGEDLLNLRFQRALQMYERARGAVQPGELCPAQVSPEQVSLFERSATEMVNAVNDEPTHRDAPLALIQAAVALECTSRFDSASRLYQRVIDEVGPRQVSDPDEQQRLDNILAQAYFRLAYTANRFFDFERAVENYRLIADSNRFTRSQAAGIQEIRTDALIARFRIAEMAFKRENWNGTISEMRDFIARYRNDPQAGELLVTAYWRIAQARDSLRQTRDYRTALQDVVNAFQQTGQAPGSIAAEFAAEANFTLADQTIGSFENFAIDPGRPASLEAYVQALTSGIQSGSVRANELVNGYAPVIEYRRPKWTIAAFVRQGRVYEILARAILNAPFVMPSDLARQIRSASPDVQEEVRLQVEDRVRQTLDAQVRPVECFGVVRYALAARAARAGSLDNEFTRTAIDRLQAYGDERIAECIAAEQQRDPTFAAYQPGEFARARAGRNPSIPFDVSAPPLALESE